MDDQSDLGRRVAERRVRLGLTLKDVARRSGVSESYLAYLETAPAPSPSEPTMEKLALALETSLSALRGSSPPSSSGSPQLEELSREECLARLAGGGVGRFVFLDGRGPVAIPVNFTLQGQDIVFRTEAGSNLALRTRQFRTSFEVDHLDPAAREGWSVVVSGRADAVTDPAEQEKLRALGPEPWAGGDRTAIYRLRTVDITGRRVVRG